MNRTQHFSCIQEMILTVKDIISEQRPVKTFSKEVIPRNKLVTNLKLNKINIQPNVIKKHKEGHLIFMKGNIYHNEHPILII